MSPAQGDPLYNCSCCGIVLVAPHYAARDCPGYGHQPPVVVAIADENMVEVFAWAAREGWSDHGPNGVGLDRPIYGDPPPITHFYGDPCHVGHT